MGNSKKIIAVVVTVAVIAGLAGYYVYKYKGTSPSVPGSNYGQNTINNAPVNNLIPEIFPSGKATLSWDTNIEPNLAGYKIYFGTAPRTDNCPSGGYPQKVDVGNKTSYTIDKLEKGKTYYFSITAYNKSGKESCFSAEVKKIIQAQ